MKLLPRLLIVFLALVWLVPVSPSRPAEQVPSVESTSLDERSCAEKKPPPEKRILGKWQATHNDETVALQFLADGTADFWDGQEKIPGDNSYKLDASKAPFHLDLTVDGEKRLTICEFTAEGGLRMAEPDDDRPKDFSQGDTLVFKKVTQ